MDPAALVDAANDPLRSTWLSVGPSSHFPVQNLPFGVGSIGGGTDRVLIRIGDAVLDMEGLADDGWITTAPGAVWRAPALNPFLEMGRETWMLTRLELARLLDSSQPLSVQAEVASHVHLLDRVSLSMPIQIGDFTDFFSNPFHARRSFEMSGASDGLPPHWWRIPVGYHARSATVVVSGERVRRPWGVARSRVPDTAPTRALDFELEVGFVVGAGNQRGTPIMVDDFDDHVFGAVLLNDWSARDFQGFESQPLGPFLAKSFATSISPWVVPIDALRPFVVETPGQDPTPPRHLRAASNRSIDLQLEVRLATPRMTAEHDDPVLIGSVSFTSNHWSPAQQLAHLTANGAETRSGDLIGSGTVSGPDPGSEGCLLEATHGGTKPLRLPNGETRTFLQDGDIVEMTGWAQRPNRPRVGLGVVRGQIDPAAEDHWVVGAGLDA